MFLIDLTYKKLLSEVEKILDEHVAFLDKYYAPGKFTFSGRSNPRTGGVILVFFPTKYAKAFASFVR